MFFLFLLVLVFIPDQTWASTDPVPGTKGWGMTVFQGTRPDTFGVIIIGTTATGAPPACDRILVRLTGQKAESTGVAAGMSGSPIYIGSELIGALSSTFPFLQEPLGLVTPLECMMEHDDYDAPPGQSEDVYHPMGYIAPGFNPESLQELLGEAGWAGRTVFSDISPGRTGDSLELYPGSPAAVVLVNGDWNLAALGTITWREGDQIVAFGHPFLSLGAVNLPLAGARITAVIPSKSLAFKIGNIGPVAGSVTFDGSNGIMGTVGHDPPLLPVRLIIGEESHREFQLGMAVHPVVTPLLIRTAVLNCFNSTRHAGADNIRVKMNVHLESYGTRQITRMERSPHAPGRIAVGMSQVVEAVMNCPLGTVSIDSLTFYVSTDTQPREHWLHSIELYPRESGDPADSVKLRIVTVDARGKKTVRTVSVVVPPMMRSSRMEIRIGDGPSTMEWERERVPLKHVASSIEEYLDLVFTSWEQDKLYITILVDKGSWSRREGEVSGLPGSMAKVLSRSVQAGQYDYVQKSVIARTEVAFNGPIHGQVILHPDRGDSKK